MTLSTGVTQLQQERCKRRPSQKPDSSRHSFSSSIWLEEWSGGHQCTRCFCPHSVVLCWIYAEIIFFYPVVQCCCFFGCLHSYTLQQNWQFWFGSWFPTNFPQRKVCFKVAFSSVATVGRLANSYLQVITSFTVLQFHHRSLWSTNVRCNPAHVR